MNTRNRLLSESNSVVDKDFEFIKPPVALKRRKVPEEVNPVAELKRLGRKDSGQLDEDEPPFNFQKMLRKTNFKRDSLKRNRDEVKKEQQVIVSNGEAELTNGIETEEEVYSGEILPGVFLEGVVIAL